MSDRVVLTGEAAADHLKVVGERAREWAALIDQEGKGTPDGRKAILTHSLYLVGTALPYKRLAEFLGAKSLGGYRQGLLDAAKMLIKLPQDSDPGKTLRAAWDDAPLRNFGAVARDVRAAAIKAGLLAQGKGRPIPTMREDATAIEDALMKRIDKMADKGATRAKRAVAPWNIKANLVARLQGIAPPGVMFREIPAVVAETPAEQPRKPVARRGHKAA